MAGGTSLNQTAARAKGVANGVQTQFADALRGIPYPRSVSFRDGAYADSGEMERVPPSIGKQYSPYGEGAQDPLLPGRQAPAREPNPPS